MASHNSVDISSLTTNADMTRMEHSLLDQLDKLFNVPTAQPNNIKTGNASMNLQDQQGAGVVDSDIQATNLEQQSCSSASPIKYALFALCSVCIQFALHYVSLISDTINGVFTDSSYIIKSICLFLLAYISYKHIDRLF